MTLSGDSGELKKEKVVAKRTAETKSKRRTKVKPMSKPATKLGSKQAKKVRGGDGTYRARNDSIWIDRIKVY